MLVADAILGVGGLIFAVNLIPTMLRQRKARMSTISLWSSASTAAVLWTYIVADVLLGLKLATVTGAATALAWTVLAYQSAWYPIAERRLRAASGLEDIPPEIHLRKFTKREARLLDG